MSAQEEFNQLVSNNRDTYATHPEDRDEVEDLLFSDNDQSPPRTLRQRKTVDSSDEDEEEEDEMTRTSNYHLPKNNFEANTGPKGVIADARAFERARKKSFRQTLLAAAGFDAATAQKPARSGSRSPSGEGSEASEDDEEERFMRRWRTLRMQELQGRGNRRPSPRGRIFGSVDTVDAAGYLDAIEKVNSDTVVVVYIFDPQSDQSAVVEECLNTIARRQPTVRFIRLHQEIAEMDYIKAPALLAYREGDVFATIVDVIRNIPKGRVCSADSLEDLLKLNRVL